MPKLTIDQERTVNVPAGKRLVNALTDEGGIDQLHACGGNAKCTTCRVLFVSGEPDQMTQAERDVLIERGLAGRIGMRLSCQIACNDDMSVRAISRLAGSGRKDVGPRPVDAIEPPPQWIDRSPSE
jgi:ferredoxin